MKIEQMEHLGMKIMFGRSEVFDPVAHLHSQICNCCLISVGHFEPIRSITH